MLRRHRDSSSSGGCPAKQRYTAAAPCNADERGDRHCRPDRGPTFGAEQQVRSHIRGAETLVLERMPEGAEVARTDAQLECIPSEFCVEGQVLLIGDTFRMRRSVVTHSPGASRCCCDIQRARCCRDLLQGALHALLQCCW